MTATSLSLWGRGLVAALITGGSSAISVALVDPDKFNIASADGIHSLVKVILSGGVIGAAAYLKQSPLPCSVCTEQATK